MSSVDEQVIDFHYELFDRIFTQPFRPQIKERLRQDAVARQVQEAAGAASQAVTRFFVSQQLTEAQVAEILRGFSFLPNLIKLEDIANPNRTPEALVEELLNKHSCPADVGKAGAGPIYRVALHQTVQVLMLVGPVMTEWQRLTFSSTYEMPRRIVSQLNQITEGLKAFASAGQAAADERYELAYRDHLLQRFYRVEAGTVRMTTNLYVDLRELFVMPRLSVRPRKKAGEDGEDLDVNALMNLSEARAVFGKVEGENSGTDDEKEKTVAATEQLRRSPRNVVVGLPGGGKSTLFEWLQLSLASIDEELVAGGGQAIPLLLRVRQLDPKKLPYGAELIEKATASHDRATLMPEGWIDRQMKAGRVLLMLDGLDETEPNIRDTHILPWLADLCKKYPKCLYLVSSRPVGYPPGALRKLKFAESDLRDFREPEIAEYTRHWCTAIRLAQNDLEEEARREGAREGDEIVSGFRGHPYIRNLARNPLMLSAICLVNYFEGGELPKDRAVLYRLCVEGLLHHWDQRRGIRSDYTLDEKLRVSREVAIAMQQDDRAEYEAAKVLKLFTNVLKDRGRAQKLLEHIRYRTGLLIERRTGVFAFAHLTFQEYLAARAVYEGNHLKIDVNHLALEHTDGRWNEVIALYCGLASAKATREMIEALIEQPNSRALAPVLAEAFLSSTLELTQDTKLRRKVLERIAICPGVTQLNRFAVEEVEPIANSLVGKANTDSEMSEAYFWLEEHVSSINESQLEKYLKTWRTLTPIQTCELVYLIHRHGTDKLVAAVANDPHVYKAQGPTFQFGLTYASQAEIALLGLSRSSLDGPGISKALLEILRVIAQQKNLTIGSWRTVWATFRINLLKPPQDVATWPECITLSRKMADRFSRDLRHASKHRDSERNGGTVAAISNWADDLERALSTTMKEKDKRHTKPNKHAAKVKIATKKPTKRRRNS